MIVKPFVFTNDSKHPCFAIAPEDYDEALLFVRTLQLRAVVTPNKSGVVMFEFPDEQAAAIARKLESWVRFGH